jgi:hypothetical protein
MPPSVPSGPELDPKARNERACISKWLKGIPGRVWRFQGGVEWVDTKTQGVAAGLSSLCASGDSNSISGWSWGAPVGLLAGLAAGSFLLPNDPSKQSGCLAPALLPLLPVKKVVSTQAEGQTRVPNDLESSKQMGLAPVPAQCNTL